MLVDDIMARRQNKLVNDIMARKQQFQRNLEELIAHGSSLRERAKEKQLNELLVDAYALVCEVATIVVKEHPNVRRQQIQAAIELHKGKIVEMENGEGKTLAATMPAYLNSLKEGHSVHIATYNDYLAHRDALWMGPIYATLGLNVGVIDSEKSYRLQAIPPSLSEPTPTQEAETGYTLTSCTRASAYECDIVYGTHAEFALDYLRDNTVTSEADLVQNDRLNFIILDEADSVLIEDAHTPVQVVKKHAVDAQRFRSMSWVANELQTPQDYIVVPFQWSIELTKDGIVNAELLLRQQGILSETGRLYSIDSPGITQQLIQALRAKQFYHRDKQYIVVDGRVEPINMTTGRSLKRSSYPGGIQQAIEAREGVEITEMNVVKASISYQHFFKHYAKMAGMTATAKEHRRELRVVYNKRIVTIDPFKPSQRKPWPDRIYKTSEQRLNGVIDEIARLHEPGKGRPLLIIDEVERLHQQGNGRPLLINVRDIKQADELGQRLRERGIIPQVLHAKNEAEEAKIIQNAGQCGALTVAAEMAGRGTDIQITEKAEQLKGLHVIGVGRHESAYMDRQLIGRAGRQGKPGSSQFFLAADDSLIISASIFNIQAMLQRLGIDDNDYVEDPSINRLIKQTQGRFGRQQFEQRRQVYERDRLLDKQRDSIYRVRRKIVRQQDLSEELATIRKYVAARAVQRYLPGRDRNHWKIDELSAYFHDYNRTHFPRSKFDFLEDRQQPRNTILPMLTSTLDSAYIEQRTAFQDGITWIQEERRLLLSHLDDEWAEFLGRLDELQEENTLRAHIGEQSFQWYAVESFKRFQEMMERVEEGFLKDMFAL